ncbi:transcriptional repressor LexA [Pseudooceanicola sediminis]|uniref:LexA repressor n=1 Tax=Pseudooceanicola sediminis TaxID=2211117 RepID=A0A399J2P7_9RHOB|nr:transcriptional repressor LexA [Pseudooceanicola sediminis]KAA2317334.1 transcriptional repressor LexA [Puniceibacterium sp. HSS470]RII39688.1 transcriptional repressor LexA [Pseudooceanicola sediminis]|tara:strand:+ start:11184 stop:11891 length:708 start_codon:yes stop_codon:yes gene_type:complete
MLTKKQLDLLVFIHKRMQRDGVPPSFDEMKEALDLRSKSGIHRLITALEERGFIRRLAHRARAIEIVKLPDSISSGAADNNVTPRKTGAGGSSSQGRRDGSLGFEVLHAMELPVMGRIAAGVPIAAISDVSHHIAVPGSMLSRGGDHFALEVNGDSMIEAGINDGDVVIIRETSTADNGDIVVALVEEKEATLKRLFRRDGNVELVAANPAYPPRLLAADKVRVQGRLVGLIRSY